MYVRSLILKDFRNYPELELEFSPEINLFLGQNAQGKTNILEAVFYASLGRSHRTHTDTDLIRWDQPGADVKLTVMRLGVENTIEFRFGRGERRRILVNGQGVRPKDLLGHLNTVLFSPEDLMLIKGAPVGRRRFLDGEISQASPAYYHELLVFQRLLNQRNALLKKIRERQARTDMLALWDDQMAVSAERIVKKRLEAVSRLSMLANLMQRRLSGSLENLAVDYDIAGVEGDTAKSSDVAKNYAAWYNKVLTQTRERDILRGTTGTGPHHDDLVFSVNGVNLRSFGSQGQQRTGVLSLKLAELEFLRAETGEYPVLLLDDVMSELDASRRRQLLAFIGRERIQTIITAADRAYFPPRQTGTVFLVKAGTVEKQG